jgi:hypothetical protein
MKKSAKQLWKKNTIKAFKQVFVLVLILTWLSIGRSGEAAKDFVARFEL